MSAAGRGSLAGEPELEAPVKNLKTAAALLLGTLLVACGPLAPTASESGAGAAAVPGLADHPKGNSQVFNGFSLNGFSLNGFSLNGFSLNGTVLNGFSLNGTALSGVTLEGSRFVATQGDTPVAGTELVGATMDVLVTPTAGGLPVPYTLKLGSITLAAGTQDVYLYEVSYQSAATSGWQSACVDSAGNPVLAVPLLNHWDAQTGARIDDPRTFTFACVNAALGKCVIWGYRPWASATRCAGTTCGAVSLVDYHQACTHLVRADYCGSGVPYTVNGTLIDIFDDLTPPIQARAGSWGLEARWTPSGASCMSGARVEDLIVSGKYPDCNADGDHGKDDFRDCNKVSTPWLITSTCESCKVK